MCLLVVLSRVRPDAPLVVAANRDELLAREADPMTVLRASGPRILGGRDRVAGGTWLAINEHGVVAALTNVPPHRAPRDPARRSRGELPLLLAEARTADEAVESFRTRVDPRDYNAAWLMVGDRDSLHYLDSSGDRLVHRALPPGVHVLENVPLEADSPKVDAVEERLRDPSAGSLEDLLGSLRALLSSHEVPARARAEASRWRPLEAEAACVHAGPYGTRTGTLVAVKPDGPPEVHSSDGPPCISPIRPVSLWRT